MAFKVSTRKVREVVVIAMAGKLTIGEPVQELRNAVTQALDSGTLRLVLDLGEVSYIDSSGLGQLTATYSSVQKKGGDVKLLNLTKRAKDLLQMTKLLTVFDTYDDEEKAIAALEGGAAAKA